MLLLLKQPCTVPFFIYYIFVFILHGNENVFALIQSHDRENSAMHFLILFFNATTEHERERKRENWKRDGERKNCIHKKKTDGIKKGNSCIDMYRIVCLLYNIQHNRSEREEWKKGHKKEENTTILYMYIRRSFFYFIFQKKEWMRIALWFEYRFLASFYYCTYYWHSEKKGNKNTTQKGGMNWNKFFHLNF